jgi:hypothetical protein
LKKSLTFLSIALLCAFALGSCQKNTDSPAAATIVGTWTLSTVQGAPIQGTGISGSIVVKSDMTFTQQLVISESMSGNAAGTVTDKGGNVFTLAQTGGTSVDATMNSAGKTLSYTHPLLGLLGFVK